MRLIPLTVLAAVWSVVGTSAQPTANKTTVGLTSSSQGLSPEASIQHSIPTLTTVDTAIKHDEENVPTQDDSDVLRTLMDISAISKYPATLSLLSDVLLFAEQQRSNSGVREGSDDLDHKLDPYSELLLPARLDITESSLVMAETSSQEMENEDVNKNPGKLSSSEHKSKEKSGEKEGDDDLDDDTKKKKDLAIGLGTGLSLGVGLGAPAVWHFRQNIKSLFHLKKQAAGMSLKPPKTYMTERLNTYYPEKSAQWFKNRDPNKFRPQQPSTPPTVKPPVKIQTPPVKPNTLPPEIAPNKPLKPPSLKDTKVPTEPHPGHDPVKPPEVAGKPPGELPKSDGVKQHDTPPRTPKSSGSHPSKPLSPLEPVSESASPPRPPPQTPGSPPSISPKDPLPPGTMRWPTRGPMGKEPPRRLPNLDPVPEPPSILKTPPQEPVSPPQTPHTPPQTPKKSTSSPKLPSPKSSPKLPSPKLPSPKFPSPKLPSPKFPSPKFLSPKFPSPKLPSPKLPSPKLPSPRFPSPPGFPGIHFPIPPLNIPALPIPPLPALPPPAIPALPKIPKIFGSPSSGHKSPKSPGSKSPETGSPDSSYSNSPVGSPNISPKSTSPPPPAVPHDIKPIEGNPWTEWRLGNSDAADEKLRRPTPPELPKIKDIGPKSPEDIAEWIRKGPPRTGGKPPRQGRVQFRGRGRSRGRGKFRAWRDPRVAPKINHKSPVEPIMEEPILEESADTETSGHEQDIDDMGPRSRDWDTKFDKKYDDFRKEEADMAKAKEGRKAKPELKYKGPNHFLPKAYNEQWSKDYPQFRCGVKGLPQFACGVD